jgi:hypothetical protein
VFDLKFAKSAKMTQKTFLTISLWVSEFDGEFESLEKVAKSLYEEIIGHSTLQ